MCGCRKSRTKVYRPGRGWTYVSPCVGEGCSDTQQQQQQPIQDSNTTVIAPTGGVVVSNNDKKGIAQ